jgi:hypothetical protein
LSVPFGDVEGHRWFIATIHRAFSSGVDLRPLSQRRFSGLMVNAHPFFVMLILSPIAMTAGTEKKFLDSP